MCRVTRRSHWPQPRNDPVHPPPEPKETLGSGDWLPAARGHRVWWCEGGDPRGTPVLIVHGGPGGASRPEPARWFAGLPVRWLMLDQRGCGRSTPLGRIVDNTLPALLRDMERLRRRLGLARWSLAGGSWGARVAMAYAEAWPDHVDGLFLRSPFLGSLAETRRYIESWANWLGPAGRRVLGVARADALAALYQAGTVKEDAASRLDSDEVARAWSAYDDAQSRPGGVAASGVHWQADTAPTDDDALRASWRVHLHHALRGWGEVDGCARGMPVRCVPADRPVALVWGTADATCDPAVAHALMARLPGAVGREVAGAGHRMSDPQLAPALRETAQAWIAALAR